MGSFSPAEWGSHATGCTALLSEIAIGLKTDQMGEYGKPSAAKEARSVCAVRRVVVSLLQAGGTEEMFLGYWHIWRRKLKETKHAREAMHAPKRCRARRSYDPLPMSKAGLPELESRRGVEAHPSEERLKPMLHSLLA